MQNKPRRILLGIGFAYADFASPHESCVPYITEGLNEKELDDEVKSPVKSVALCWLDPKVKDFCYASFRRKDTYQ